MIWTLIISSYLSLFVFGITDNIRGPLFPEIIKAFGLSDSNASLIFALSSLSGFIISFLSVYLLKRFSRKSVLEFFTLLLCFTLFGFGLVNSFYAFIVLSIIFGFSSGVLGLVPNILVPLGSKIETRQQVISGLHAMYGISSLIAPLFVALVFYFNGNWRTCFFVSSVFPLILYFYIFKKDKLLFDMNKSVDTKKRKTFNRKNIRPQLYLAFSLCFTVIAEVMMSSRLALYVQREKQADIKIASFYVTLFFLAMLLGRVLFTIKKFHYETRNILTFIGFFTICFLFLGLYVHPAYIIISGFFVAPYYPLLAAFIAEEFPDEIDQAMSIVVSIDSVMLAIMHIFIGWLSDIYGIRIAMYSGLISLVLSILFINIYPLLFKKLKVLK